MEQLRHGFNIREGEHYCKMGHKQNSEKIQPRKRKVPRKEKSALPYSAFSRQRAALNPQSQILNFSIIAFCLSSFALKYFWL